VAGQDTYYYDVDEKGSSSFFNFLKSGQYRMTGSVPDQLLI